MLGAYFDESETNVLYGEERSGETVATLACLVAPAETWCRFTQAWDAAMERGGAAGKHLHMKDLVHAQREFDGWTDAMKRALLQKLVPVLSMGPLIMCGSVPLNYWVDAYAVPLKEAKIDAYVYSLQTVMYRIVQTCRPTADNPVACFMEQNQATDLHAAINFHSVVEMFQWRALFTSLVSSPKGPAALQAADLVAYEGSRYASEHVVGHGPRKPRKSFLEIQKLPNVIFSVLEREEAVREAAHLAGWPLAKEREPELYDAVVSATTRAMQRAQRERSIAGAAAKRAAPALKKK